MGLECINTTGRMNNKIVKIQRGVLVILVQTVFKIRKNIHTTC